MPWPRKRPPMMPPEQSSSPAPREEGTSDRKGCASLGPKPESAPLPTNVSIYCEFTSGDSEDENQINIVGVVPPELFLTLKLEDVAVGDTCAFRISWTRILNKSL